MAKKVYVITGPIGSGKSTAIKYLNNKGFSTVDLDKVSNDILNSILYILISVFFCIVLAYAGFTLVNKILN